MAEAPFRGQKSVSAGGDEQSHFSLVRGIGVKVKLAERGESPSALPSPLGTQDLIFVSPPERLPVQPLTSSSLGHVALVVVVNMV